jgi:hypothetical protein
MKWFACKFIVKPSARPVAYLAMFSIMTVSIILFGAWYLFRPHREFNVVPREKISEAFNRETTETLLKKCIGQSAKEVTQLLKIENAKWLWTDEPPGILRGICYYSADDRIVTLYIAEGEPLFRRFAENRQWDFEAFLSCRIGGIQYRAGELSLDIGEAVPFQFRRQ